MSIVTLADFKTFMRELSGDLDAAFTLALNAAEAEATAFVGTDIEELFGSNGVPSDVVMGVLLLGQVHADAGSVQDAEYRRGAAQSLLRPYRVDTGMQAA